MAYIKNNWLDQEVERPRTYEMIDNSDGSVTLIDSFGLVSELGTPVNADNMNHIEDGIENNDKRITILESEGERANTSLSNLTEEGEKHFLNKSQITNCILEIPQRIKYTLVNGVLTVLAGSIAIVPYGTEDKTAQYPIGSTFLNDNYKVYDTQFEDNKFFVWVELVNDLSPVTVGNDSRMIMLMYDGTITTSGTQFICSGTTSNSSRWYDTTANLIKEKDGNNWNTNTFLSFPLMICSANGTSFTSVKQVFNGIGYLGSTVWIDKDVKGLTPNGRNEDGTLKNEEWKTNGIKIRTFNNTVETATSIVTFNPNIENSYPSVNSPFGVISKKCFYYDLNKNRNYNLADNTEWRLTPIVLNISIIDGVITEFGSLKPTFKALDYSDSSTISGWGMPDRGRQIINFTLGATGSEYIAPANGYVVFSKQPTAAGQYVEIYTGVNTRATAVSSSSRIVVYAPVKCGSKFGVTYTASGATSSLVFVFAEGEV